MAHFSIKNENSSCEVFLFCQNKVPNQFPIFVMKYAYGSGNLNLVRSAMAQAANKANCMPRELSFKSALQLLRAFAVQLCCGINDRINMLCDVLIRSIGKKKLPHRPGRVEPRAVKRRPKGHVFLTQVRAVLKAQLQVQRDLKMVGVFA